MRINSVTYKIILTTFVLVSLSLYGSGCGNSNGGGSTTDTNSTPVSVVSYVNDIQPIFNDNCSASSCHGAGAPSGLRLTSYNNFAKGGVSGKAFIAGDSANSLIIKRLDGTIGPRMPKGMAPLKADQIQAIKDWIDAGAKDN
jgi:hypothetical protein